MRLTSFERLGHNLALLCRTGRCPALLHPMDNITDTNTCPMFERGITECICVSARDWHETFRTWGNRNDYI